MKNLEWPIILQDSREQSPLKIEGFPVEVEGLCVGDYSVKGFHTFDNPALAVERKSLSDLVGSLTAGRERFHRELNKLQQFRFKAILIEATRKQIRIGDYRSNAMPQSILASLDAIAVRANIHIFYCDDATDAARQLEALVRQFCRGIIKNYEILGKACNCDA